MTSPLWTEERIGERIYQALHQRVTGPHAHAGQRLASLRKLAQAFGASLPTVQRALDRLQADGLIVKRRGSGCFIAERVGTPLSLSESVMLCMEGRGHLWGAFSGMLSRRLQAAGRFVTLLDTTQPDWKPLLERAVGSEARCLIMHGHAAFPFQAAHAALARGKRVLAAVDWQPDEPMDGVDAVLSDGLVGGRLVAEHLWQAGHRCVLLTGTSTQIHAVQHGCWHRQSPGLGFAQHWQALGGRFHCFITSVQPEALESPGQPETIDTQQLVDSLIGPHAATAVFGLMDAATVSVQQLVRQIDPALLHRLAWLGYGDTPWAVTAPAPFSSVDLDLRQIADALVQRVQRIAEQPDAEPEQLRVPPRLVPRARRTGLESAEPVLSAPASSP